MNFPANLKYTKEHEWIRVEGNTAYVGVTWYAQKELGDIATIRNTFIGFQTYLYDKRVAI